MANASRDQNRVPVILAALNTNGTTPTAVLANPTSHVLKVSDGTTGSDNGVATAQRDQNRVHILMATSNADGKTPIELYVDSSGNLLIKTT